MDRRRHLRLSLSLPVRIWGMDAHAMPFMQLASAVNISSSGARIQGLRRQVRAGEILEVQMGEEKASIWRVYMRRARSESESHGSTSGSRSESSAPAGKGSWASSA